jgi:hypothetical protein
MKWVFVGVLEGELYLLELFEDLLDLLLFCPANIKGLASLDSTSCLGSREWKQ